MAELFPHVLLLLGSIVRVAFITSFSVALRTYLSDIRRGIGSGILACLGDASCHDSVAADVAADNKSHV
jgi:hypothetical protein